MHREPHRIVALALERVVAFDLAVPAEVFSLAGPERYSFEVCSVKAASVPTTTGFSIAGVAGPEALERADTVVVPGYSAITEPLPAGVAERLNAVIERGARVTSICTGAFALGHAGLLDGRPATTHWFAARGLAELFPLACVDPDVLYVGDGSVITSAGLSAGIDLCLHLIRADHGERIAANVARAMVAPPHRDGGQAQFISRPLPSAAGSLDDVRAWALDHLTEPLDVNTLAGQAAMSPRTFARRFVAETGTTPLKWLHTQRVLEARRLLEATDLPVEDVASKAGFGSAPSLREHFRRATATTPTAYRRSFRGAGARSDPRFKGREPVGVGARAPGESS